MTITAELADGTRLEFPDGTDPTVIQSTVRNLIAKGQPQAPQTPKATAGQEVVASVPGAIMRGMRNPLDGAAQYLPWALGAVTGGFGMAPNRVSNALFAESERVGKMNAEAKRGYERAREASGKSGIDVGQLIGEAVSPVYAPLMGAGAALPATTIGRAAYGAGGGGSSAALAPVEGDPAEFGGKKLAQAAGGAAAGAVMAPAAAKLSEVIGPRIDLIANKVKSLAGKQGTVNETTINSVIRSELAREKINFDEIPEAIRASVRRDVQEALNAGRSLSPADALRAADFRAVGTQGLRGQITRDPVQYTREMNIRGVGGVCDPIAQRLAEQRQAFGNVLDNLGANRAIDRVVAGESIISSLQRGDKPREAAVNAAYQAARDSSGRYAPLNHVQFVKQANDALDSMQLGPYLPAQIRSQLNDIATGKLPLDVNVATQLQSVWGAAARGGQPVERNAIGQLLTALRGTDLMPEQSAGGLLPSGGQPAREAFQKAKNLASQRFGLMDDSPALKEVLRGTPNPDTFVARNLLGAQTKQVQATAGLLDAEGKEVARNQIASYLERKAFGANRSGDAPFAIERFNQALDDIGRGKLSAFFGPEEVDQLYTLGRAAAWAGKQPAGSAVNNSNTAAAAFSLMQRLKGASIALPVVKQFADTSFVNRALTQPTGDPLPMLTPSLLNLTTPGVLATGSGLGGLLGR